MWDIAATPIYVKMLINYYDSEMIDFVVGVADR